MSVPFLLDHFSNNDYLRVRVRVIWHLSYTKGVVRGLRQELGFEEMYLEKRSGVRPFIHSFFFILEVIILISESTDNDDSHGMML